MAPYLFGLVFLAKPLHNTKTDLNKHKDLLISRNVYRRKYNPNGQIKRTNEFKYQMRNFCIYDKKTI